MVRLKITISSLGRRANTCLPTRLKNVNDQPPPLMSRLVLQIGLCTALGLMLPAAASAEESPQSSLRELQSRKFPKPIHEMISAIRERMEEAGGKCHITVSYYPEGEGQHSGVGSCKFTPPEGPSTLDKVAKGANFIPLVGTLVSMGLNATSEAIKDKEKESFISSIRFEAVGTSKTETTLRMRALTSRQKMVVDGAYYKELFSRIEEASRCLATELTLNDHEN
jgi:hypothetical protein